MTRVISAEKERDEAIDKMKELEKENETLSKKFQNIQALTESFFKNQDIVQ